jgi:rRNA maturation protein Nop10
MRSQSFTTNNTDRYTRVNKCPHCGRSFRGLAVHNHARHCVKNPERKRRG